MLTAYEGTEHMHWRCSFIIFVNVSELLMYSWVKISFRYNPTRTNHAIRQSNLGKLT